MTHPECSTTFYFSRLCTPICPSIIDCFMFIVLDCGGYANFSLFRLDGDKYGRCGDFSLISLDLVSLWNVLDVSIRLFVGGVSDGMCYSVLRNRIECSRRFYEAMFFDGRCCSVQK